MSWQVNPYAVALIASALLSGGVSISAWRRRSAPGAAPLALLTSAAAVWSLGYGIATGFSDLSARLFWAKVQYVGIAVVPTAMLVLILEYTGRYHWVTKRNLALLAIMPLVTALLAWTNEFHGLIWADFQVVAYEQVHALDLQYGPIDDIIRDGLRRERPLDMHLLYGSRTPDDVIYGAELSDLAAAHANFRYTLVISEPPPGYTGVTGFLDADLVRQQVGDVTGKTFYVCGPQVMYDFCLAALEGLGVPTHRVRRELYGPPADVTQEPGWPAEVAACDTFDVAVEGREPLTIRAPAGEPLLNSLERYSVVLPAVCRSGECSACRVRLLAGRVFQPARVGLRQSDREHGYIHACVSYPLENLRIRLP
ncbi:MAG TPA: 2Fe-2S iron-sulfur cluster binding domain-containing protein [Chloroflexi bacterium]|nr:2Fe-2S iron-sulfur cluster binding domain-containing protein [Chloroflexota bacterium]